jgi:hypothetical protein
MKWLQRLKSENAPDTHATNATKPGFVAFVACPAPPFENIEVPDSLPANDADAAQGPDPDGWCWPHSTAMNTAEIDIFTARLIHFTSRSVSSAEELADRLVQRDRGGDDRHLCVECRRCRPGPRCSKGLAVLDVLQRCNHFDRSPNLERFHP